MCFIFASWERLCERVRKRDRVNDCEREQSRDRERDYKRLCKRDHERRL